MATDNTEQRLAESASVAKRRRRSIEDRLYDGLGNKWGGNTTPPMDNRQYRYDRDGDSYSVFSQGDDGGTMWIGYADEWKFHVELDRFRRIAAWTLWQWAWHDWFGVRTKLWYRLLHRKVNRYRRPA